MKLTLEQIKAKAVREIEISGWEPEETFTVTIKPVSIFGLATQGKVPNSLLGTAVELFEGKQSSKKKEGGETDMKSMAQVVDLMLHEALVEPLYAEVKDYLTDNQRMEIFNATLGEVKSLEKFRKK